MTIKWMNRQNVIAHMTLWGLVSGALLGAGYALLLGLVVSLANMSYVGYPPNILELLPGILFMIFYGVMLGSVAGLPLGIANGLLMGLVKQSRHLTLRRKKQISYGINLLLVLAVVFFLSDGFRYLYSDWFLIGAPSIVAGGASLLATDRHFAHLNPRKAKGKRIPAAQ